MTQNELHQFIREDIARINSLPRVRKKGTVGPVLGQGTYGFVCQWTDDSGSPKVVKILDPVYVAKRNSDSAPQMKQILSASIYLRPDQWVQDGFSLITIEETHASEKLAGTKNKHLMTILDGSQNLRLEDRHVQMLVMPKLKTIEELPISDAPEHQIVEFLTQCCEGLHTLHQEPKILQNTTIGLDALIHNDLKPDNIFVASHTSGDHCTDWYIIGDYSSCLNVKSLEVFFPGAAYPKELRQNPYCAPGEIGITSDIWSLGWILWYWMNGKQHPKREDIESRATRSGTRKPKNWGDNPELWEVFLNMTEYEPTKRYQTVDILQAELHRALQARDRRLAKNNSRDSAIAAGTLVSLVYLVLSGIKSLAPDEKPDAQGYLHGKISKAYSFLDGSFKGEWQHGYPVKGEFTYKGVTKKGSWMVKKDYKVPFSTFGHMTFSGLICTNEDDDFYQGVAKICWTSGTIFETELRNGEIHNGIMTWQDGTVSSGDWKLIHDSDFSGILCGKGDDLLGCGTLFLPGNVCYEGELKHTNPTSGTLVFPNRRISMDAPAFRTAWNLLMKMERYRGSFFGDWSPDGYPEQGSFTFSNGDKVCGRFSYSSSEAYTGMLRNDRACGIGSHPLAEHMTRTGEFLEGDCVGNVTVKHECGAYFFGRWYKGQVPEGTLYYTDGSNKFSRNWTWAETKLRSGNIIRGLFCDHHKQACGIGTVLFPSMEMEFRGEVRNGDTRSGSQYDMKGNRLP